MDSRDREQRYDDYIERPSQAAAAIGRRPPYHLEYLRRHGGKAGEDRGDPACGGRVQDARRAGQAAAACMEGGTERWVG